MEELQRRVICALRIQTLREPTRKSVESCEPETRDGVRRRFLRH
jgi:hypothetical protein